MRNIGDEMTRWIDQGCDSAVARHIAIQLVLLRKRWILR